MKIDEFEYENLECSECGILESIDGVEHEIYEDDNIEELLCYNCMCNRGSE
jgi:hypothetical protein